MKIRFAAWLAFVCSLMGVATYAGAEPTGSVSTATREFSGALSEVDGFCTELTATPRDILATVPARLTSARLGEVRYLEIMHSDAADTGTPVCVSVGDTLGASLSCALNTNTVAPMFFHGASRVFLLNRTKQRGSITGALPALWGVAPSGETVTVCVTLGI